MLASICGFSACQPWTVKPIGYQKGKPGESARLFNAAAYVDSVWESRVVPTVVNQAVDLATVMRALEDDPEAAKRQYGHRESTTWYQFMVRGEGVVTAVDSHSPGRTLTVTLTGYQGQTKVLIQLGPAIKGTSMRDAVGFIRFDQFANQLHYAEVANELNDRALKSAAEGLDLSGVKGQPVSFYGVFTLIDTSKILITPVELEWKGKR